MARPLRLTYLGALSHVTSRGHARESSLLELCRYVVLNPVQAGLVQAPNDYPWSSYRSTVGADPTPAWLTPDWVLAPCGQQRHRAQARYQALVQKGVGHLGP